ncbi:ADP-ribosylation/Crystallin J1 [Beutenbergia cavernae DSM 12333]|uniref:ADP-ribosylation/Crystallin J1 n=1 Tax=Beutenbergia cavernae (strain ATCC BAA-8 / DSM 12333 / CCUG 43141 / JCM 11478 / NBRC 16432 / NCIMB 13614 / HKI 0122) TaxID=471853 RepID=C5C2P5_BEUC1|nr:ADP-ribosylglycohydrolase family protein [Beutenbergia cavernae]ACQ79731.1 ADP-ribosylation/Crystallin J1 [Beutenbergia cavernae DSM 12333]
MSAVAAPVSRARGALLGLAVGDAVGFPSLYHRGIRAGGRRAWSMGVTADEQRVTRFGTPFSMRGGFAPWAPTDDAEAAAVGALLVLGLGDDDRGPAARWAALMSQEAWGSVAERGALANLANGLVPPASGTDNPHAEDDSAVPRVVPAGIRHAGDPDAAAALAVVLAEVTNGRDGVWAASAVAAAVAVAVGGGGMSEAVAAGAARMEPDSWIRRNLDRARVVVARHQDLPTALPELVEEVAPATYSHGSIAPETVPLAFVIAEACEGDVLGAVTLAAAVHRQADSMPAIVGALVGAVAGAEAIPTTWRERVDELAGTCVPAVGGQRLTELADRLAASWPAVPDGGGAAALAPAHVASDS